MAGHYNPHVTETQKQIVLTKTFSLKYKYVHSSIPNKYNKELQYDVHFNFCSYYQQMVVTINKWQLLSA